MLDVVVSSSGMGPARIKIALTDPGPVTMSLVRPGPAVHPAKVAEYLRANPENLCTADEVEKEIGAAKLSEKMANFYRTSKTK